MNIAKFLRTAFYRTPPVILGISTDVIMGDDNRCKIILYRIFVIKTSFDKTEGFFPETIMSKSQSPFI